MAAAVWSWIASVVVLGVAGLVLYGVDLLFLPYALAALGAVPVVLRRSRRMFLYVLIVPYAAAITTTLLTPYFVHLGGWLSDRIVPAVLASWLAWIIAVVVLYLADG